MIELSYNLRIDGDRKYHDFTTTRDGKFVSCLVIPSESEDLTRKNVEMALSSIADSLNK